MELLDRTEVDLRGKHVVVLGRSNLVGVPVALMALHRDASVCVLHRHAPDVPAQVRRADVVIAAVGQPEFVKADWIKEGAVVIDVGINFVNVPGGEGKSGSRMCGDVDFEGVSQVAAHITPVPGGVGPMTICMLMRNTLANAQAHTSAPASGV
jgi:5,10-methylene-tetrahydrofolate dehydrogenase/methenyl tetrahydrofolate cyclohydrolase